MCPNYFTVSPCLVAVTGSASFNVSQINVSTVTLDGVAPTSYFYKDIATDFLPYLNKPNCNSCTTQAQDGYVDLGLYFPCVEVRPKIDFSLGDCQVVTLTGELDDGTPIEGQDNVLLSCGQMSLASLFAK